MTTSQLKIFKAETPIFTGVFGLFWAYKVANSGYNVKTDESSEVEANDSRIVGTKYANQVRQRAIFGDVYLFLSILQTKTPFMEVLRTTFTDMKQYQQGLTHFIHECLKNQEAVLCKAFHERSMASFFLKDFGWSTLDCDTAFYKYMGDEKVKTKYFKTLLKVMRKTHPNFGRACYVDSTPIPTDTKSNPFASLCSHGTDGLVRQCRLALLLDIETNIPVWFGMIYANTLDHCTIKALKNDVKAILEVDVDIVQVDAGYACKELFQEYRIDAATAKDESGNERDHYVLVRMPAKREYPHDELYKEVRNRLMDPSYTVVADNHTYFAETFLKEVSSLDIPEYCYVFLDRERAQELWRGWRIEHENEWKSMSPEDQFWYSVKDGFFILISNKKFSNPLDALVEYLSRGKIEAFFKDAKSYLRIMSAEKWLPITLKGKMLSDIIVTTLYEAFRKEIAVTGMSMSRALTLLNGLDCTKVSEEMAEVSVPNIDVKELFGAVGFGIPTCFDMKAFRKELLYGETMDRSSYAIVEKKANPSFKPKHSPLERERLAEEKKAEREKKKAEEKTAKAIERERQKAEKAAERERLKAEKAAERERLKAEKAAERERLKAEKAAERERLKAEKAAERERLKAEKVAERERMRAEKAVGREHQEATKCYSES